MAEPSTKPYLIRAIHEWCADCGLTPYVTVAVDETVQVPREFVRNGEIVLNVSALATSRLQLGNDEIRFQARFGGVPREVIVPIHRVIAIYARENGQGMAFEVPADAVGAVSPAERAPAAQPVQGAALRAELVPVGPSVAAADPGVAEGPGDDDAPPPAPRSGERPKLTRVK